jgi:zinc protease
VTKSLRGSVLLFLPITLLAQQAPAPAPESLKGVVQKKLAPVSKEVLHVRLPRPAERKLKNGLPVLVVEKHKIPTVNFDLVIPASNLAEPAELTGLAECTAEMLRMGTKTRSARQIAESLSELGASVFVNAPYATRNVQLTASALSENLDPLLDILADMLLNPTFPQGELDKWKARRASQLQQMRAAESFLGSERLRSVLYPADARRVNAPTPESLKKITRDQVVEFYKANYRPGSSLLGVTGDVRTAAIVEKLTSASQVGRAEARKISSCRSTPRSKRRRSISSIARTRCRPT